MSLSSFHKISFSALRNLDDVLELDEVTNVFKVVYEVRSKCELFGLLLNIPRYEVINIVNDYDEPIICLFETIKFFMKQFEPLPSWRVIIDALRNPLMGEYGLANEIEKKYCFQQKGNCLQ